MRILYISALPKTMSGGPKYSVPNQVNAQANYDEVCWINITQWGINNSLIPCECIMDSEKQRTRIIEFKPDLVVFEDLYYMEFYRIAKMLILKDIPYVIVPRGCLTHAAQKQKWYKKVPANILFFVPFSRHAAAIEFLTDNERDSSGRYWNKKSIIVPNGTSIPEKHAYPSITKGLFQGTFIGRINPYHKGLDVFFKVCEQLKPLLIEKKCKLDFYGPYPVDVGESVKKDIVDRGLESIISIHREVHGKEKESILINSDFFILTSRFEGLPMGLLEALSYGLPAIVTHETNIGEMIDDAGAGFSSSCTTDGIESSLRKLLMIKEEEIRKMSLNACSFSKRFDWNEIAKKAHDDYLRILGKKKEQ